MTSFVIRDVTAYSTENSRNFSGLHETRSTITPFQKVLEKEEDKTVKAAAKIVKSSTVDTDTDLENSGSTKVSLQGIFEMASQKYNISYDFLVAVAKAESDFNTKCVSTAGAKGIMQLMPYECKEFGVKDPYDAEQNIMAAAKLLKAHLKKFDGDYILAAAAYNAGSGAVQKYDGVPPYTETQNYVKKIKKYMSEGVTVPDKKVKVGLNGSSEGEGGATSVPSTKTSSNKTAFDEGQNATEEDLEGITVSVGTGDSAVTMTYGAYLKYLELGSMGVG